MNQGKLDMVRQKIARVNINILGIGELKWIGMGEFHSDDHYIYYCGQESLRRRGVALIVNKSLKCIIWVHSQKLQNDLSSFPRQTVQHYFNPSVYPNHWCQRSWSWMVLWRTTTPSRTNTKNRYLFIIGDWNAKVGSRDTWQVWPWSTKWSREKAKSFVKRTCWS